MPADQLTDRAPPGLAARGERQRAEGGSQPDGLGQVRASAHVARHSRIRAAPRLGQGPRELRPRREVALALPGAARHGDEQGCAVGGDHDLGRVERAVAQAARVQGPQRPADRAEHGGGVARPEAEVTPADQQVVDGRTGRHGGGHPDPAVVLQHASRSASGPAAPAGAGGAPHRRPLRPAAAAATPGRRPAGTRCPALSPARPGRGTGAPPAGTGARRRSNRASWRRSPGSSSPTDPEAGPFMRRLAAPATTLRGAADS